MSTLSVSQTGTIGSRWDWRRDGPISAYALLTLVDMAITLPFWDLESNPVVLELGLLPFVGIKAGVCLAAIGVWYHWGVYRSRVGVAVVMAYAGLMAVVVSTNVAYVVWVV